jgi:hypothetical protein
MSIDADCPAQKQEQIVLLSYFPVFDTITCPVRVNGGIGKIEIDADTNPATPASRRLGGGTRIVIRFKPDFFEMSRRSEWTQSAAKILWVPSMADATDEYR